jgi:hypothetical protein
MLFVQWKLQRTELAGLTLCAALIAPVALWPRMQGEFDRVGWLTGMIDTGSMIGPAGAWLAVILGALLAIRPFILDARSRHTYALALPVPRVVYAWMRAATGLTLCLLPAAGFLIGALIAAESIPDTMLVRKFPFQLSLRFLLALATAFSAVFAFQYGLGGKAKRWLVIVCVTVVGCELIAQLALHNTMIGGLAEFLTGSFSPVSLFRNRWVLFDV